MTPELLKLYTALQPLFRERMGEWQYGDMYCMPSGTVGFYIEPVNDLPIRIPRTIDDSSPEAQKRSLWGMVDWGVWRGEVTVSGRFKMLCGYTISFEATPTEAILRALIVQEGVEG